jgi:hypothetical protein
MPHAPAQDTPTEPQDPFVRLKTAYDRAKADGVRWVHPTEEQYRRTRRRRSQARRASQRANRR